MKTRYSRSFLDGFDHSIVMDELKKITQYETDILRKIKRSKEKQVSVSKYMADFTPEEKRRFLGLIKRFDRVKISYRREAGIACRYLIAG